MSRPAGSVALVAVLLCAGLGIALPHALAQSVPKPARIAILCGGQCTGTSYDAFREALQSVGRVEGRNLVFDVRGADGHQQRLPALVAELLAGKPDLLVAVSPQPVLAAKQATSAVPILMLAVADPVGSGIVQSLASPGGNITGFTTLEPGAFMSKSLQLLKELVPGMSRVAALRNPANAVAHMLSTRELPPAADALGLRVQVVDIVDRTGIATGVDAARRGGAEAVFVIGDPMFHRPAGDVPELMARHRLPAIYIDRDVVAAGGLMSYGPDFAHMFRRAALTADRILKGAKPADIPVEQPTKYRLSINQRTAKALDLTVPPSLLLHADEVVE